MTHGRPDFTSSINITGQDLLEVIERPKYGSAQFAHYDDYIMRGGFDRLFVIAGTGMIYGGVIKHTGPYGPNHIEIDVFIDYSDVEQLTIYTLNDWQVEAKNMLPVWEQYYNTTQRKYIQGISSGITFEESFELQVANHYSSGATDTIEAHLIYALI